jgi:hypothetical protein
MCNYNAMLMKRLQCIYIYPIHNCFIFNDRRDDKGSPSLQTPSAENTSSIRPNRHCGTLIKFKLCIISSAIKRCLDGSGKVRLKSQRCFFCQGRLRDSGRRSDLLACLPQLPSVYFRHTYSGKIVQCVQHSLYWLRAAWPRAVRGCWSQLFPEKKADTPTLRFPTTGLCFSPPKISFRYFNCVI